MSDNSSGVIHSCESNIFFEDSIIIRNSNVVFDIVSPPSTAGINCLVLSHCDLRENSGGLSTNEQIDGSVLRFTECVGDASAMSELAKLRSSLSIV